MKKLIVALSAGALLMGTTAMADSENAAWVYKFDNICGMYVPGVGVVSGGDYHLVMTKSGNATYSCNNMIVPEGNEPAKAINDRVPCYVFSRTDGIEEGEAKRVVTPAGNAHFTCSYKAEKED